MIRARSSKRWLRQGAGGVVALALGVAIVGCAHPSAGSAPGTGAARFASAAYDVAMVYPGDLEARDGFESGYFLGDRWNPDAAGSTLGKGLLTLSLPESNKRVTGELRLGVSDAAEAVADCRLPDDGNAGSVSTAVVDGVQFKRRDTGDAGMNHFLSRHAYRGVARGHCYAIDLIVDGTNPGVYPNDPTPPMTRRAAFKRLSSLLDGLSFSGS